MKFWLGILVMLTSTVPTIWAVDKIHQGSWLIGGVLFLTAFLVAYTGIWVALDTKTHRK